jgi:hypothetical protein
MPRLPPPEFGFLLLGQTLDVATTLWGLHEGLRESNSLMSLGFQSIGFSATTALAKFATTFALMGLYEFSDEVFGGRAEDAREGLRVAAGVMGAAFVGAAIWNLWMIARKRSETPRESF